MPRHGDKCVVKSCAAVVPFLHIQTEAEREVTEQPKVTHLETAELKLDAQQLGSRAWTPPAAQTAALGLPRAQGGAPRPLPETPGAANPHLEEEGWHPLVLEASSSSGGLWDCYQIKGVNKIY